MKKSGTIINGTLKRCIWKEINHSLLYGSAVNNISYCDSHKITLGEWEEESEILTHHNKVTR